MAQGGSNMNQELGSGGGNDTESTDEIIEDPPISAPPPPGVIILWNDVASGIDRSQTVAGKSAVDSLDHASRHLYASTEARRFVENHMKPVISILLGKQPSEIGQMENGYVEESLRLAVTIVAMDLEAKKGPDTNIMIECTVLETLSMIFNPKKTFYEGSKQESNVTLNGAPEVRMQMIRKFWAIGGFAALATYLENRAEANAEQFPNLDVLHSLLNSIADAVPTNSNVVDAGSKPGKYGSVEDTVIRICQAVMMFIDGTSEESMKKQANDTLSRIRYGLQIIFDKLASMRRKETFAFYQFWRRLTLKLITSESFPLRLFGWEQVGELIDASVEMRPPPKYFIVEEAGRHFVNGKYIYNGQMDEDGYARLGGETSYVLFIPKTVPEKDGGGKTMTLFRCNMRSQQKWWFLSEADEDEPGTDKDKDYYQHKSRVHEESEPPLSGWSTCIAFGQNPPPTLRKFGLIVPAGEEFNTLEHQLAKWAIDNRIIELVLGDSVHREVVARSLPLIKFLASMCERDVAVDNESMGEDPTAMPSQNEFCLQASHLLLAWKTCTSKADAAVSAEVYHLLVSILPSLPDDLAIPLLSAIQKSLLTGAEKDKRDLLPEIAEFCSTLANASRANWNVTGTSLISDAVRTQVLKLIW
eukprot:CAMPEP_0195508440 /NCGR_PEP_ID=MMETSP0794_2-20130614/1643_1 /TAXON_ID=515487 /ORGANISM="Stephanopyxis turris, Strain CCMP 815" /LENGTH=642 /DNA_ID=CAMNT_0040635399 /DNA_START=81 /DNA_END=2006 /DNA_ORIENTATION=-